MPNDKEMMMGKCALVWHDTANLDPLEGSEWDSIGLKQCSTSELE